MLFEHWKHREGVRGRLPPSGESRGVLPSGGYLRRSLKCAFFGSFLFTRKEMNTYPLRAAVHSLP